MNWDFLITFAVKFTIMSNTEIERTLESKGVRPTANRILVMKELVKATHPVSLADLEACLGFSMDRASIFRVLELFAEKDVVHVIEDGSRSIKYELCQGTHHSIADQHVHFFLRALQGDILLRDGEGAGSGDACRFPASHNQLYGKGYLPEMRGLNYLSCKDVFIIKHCL